MTPTRIACVNYLNTAPLIEGLDKLGGVTLLPAVPSRIAGMVRRGDADLGLCSIVDAAADDRPPLTPVPAGMIGCDGTTLTVRLFSRVPLGQITQLHADADSHTSVVLCRLLLRLLHGVSPPVVDFNAAGHAGPLPPTVLLIGDKVVTAAPPEALYSHQLDLGQAWRDLAGLPFLYATWMCRTDRADDPAIHAAAAMLDRQRRRNLARLHWLIAKHAPAHAWPLGLAGEYLGRLLRYRVGPRERDAAQRFFDMAADAGLLPRTALEWLETSPERERRDSVMAVKPAR